MNKAIKWGLIICVGLVVLVIATLLIAPAFIDIRDYKPEIEKLITDKTGRPFTIGEDLNLSLFPWAGVSFSDAQLGYQLRWLVPESNEKEMEPILLQLERRGAFKTFEPSPAETFLYVLSGLITVRLGKKRYHAKTGDSVYYHASEEHQLINEGDKPAKVLLVATESYL